MPTIATIACPYCNAYLPLPAAVQAGQRLPCPRCGEAFTYLPAGGFVGAPAARAPSVTSFAAEPPPAVVPTADTFAGKIALAASILSLMAVVGLPFSFWHSREAGFAVSTLFVLFCGGAFAWLWFFRIRRSNVVTALFVVCNMLILAVASLGGALASQHYRRSLDAGLPVRPRSSPAGEETALQGPAPLAPSRLAALGYLPTGTNLLAGLHVADLLADPLGQKLLDEPIRIGAKEIRLGRLAPSIGLSLIEIDHIVIGLPADAPLSVVLVVRTREAFDANKVRTALNAQRLKDKPGGHELFQFKLAPWDLPALGHVADGQTLLIGLAREALVQAAGAPLADLEQLPPDVREVLRERIATGALVWLAGHADDWAKTAAGAVLADLPAPDRDRLLTVQSLAAWAQPGNDAVTLSVVARCADDKAAESLETWLTAKMGANPAELKQSREGAWLTVQFRSPGDLRELLAR